MELPPVWHLPVRWKRLQSDVTDVVGGRTERQTQTKAVWRDLSRLRVQHEMQHETPAYTVSIVPSQRLFYAANFLNVLQLATYHWLRQLRICMKHSHSPTKQTERKKVHTLSISAVPFHLLRMHVCLGACMDRCTSPGDQHCVAQFGFVFFCFLYSTVMPSEVRNPWVNFLF